MVQGLEALQEVAYQVLLFLGLVLGEQGPAEGAVDQTEHLARADHEQLEHLLLQEGVLHQLLHICIGTLGGHLGDQ